MTHKNYEDWTDQWPNICPYDDRVPEYQVVMSWKINFL